MTLAPQLTGGASTQLVRYIDLSDSYENGAELSNYVAAHENGLCVIVTEQAKNPAVRKLLQEIEDRLGLRVERQYASLEEVTELRRKGLAGRRGDTGGEMQKRILDLIEDAYKKRASDIHFEVGSEITTVQFRIHGRLIKQATWASDTGQRFLGAAYAMAELANQTFTEARGLRARLAPRPGKDRWAFPQGLEALRMQFNPIAFGYNYAVFRLVETLNVTSDTMENLGYEPEQLAILLDFSSRTQGLGIIAGPTNSGKSTTISANLIRTRESDLAANNVRSIYTVEDPPERRLPGAQQVVVPNTETDEERARAYADAIRDVLRSDPDIIMVGEIRDRTTAVMTVGASVSGHQIWTTLHCSSAHSIPMRLCDLGADQSMIFDSGELYVAAAQVLVPLLCQHCCVPGAEAEANGLVSRAEAELYRTAFGDQYFIEGRGCAHCGHLGVKGRTLLAEVIRTDLAYMNVLRTGGLAMARQFCRERGEPSIADVGVRKVRRGIVSARDVARVTDLKEMAPINLKVAAE